MSFQMLNDYEHVLQKIPMYAGSEKHVITSTYILKDDMILKTEIEVVPAILKLISELIDNSVDEFIRTNGEYANKIDILINEDTVNVRDNGRGIPVKEVQTYKGIDWQPKLSWTELKAGTNFGKDDTTTIGTFGVGSSLCSVLSQEFIGISDDGEQKCTVTCVNNNEKISTKVSKSTSRGCNVTMKIDMKRFANGKLDIIDDNHLLMVKQRLINLSLTYPNITFTLNKQKIKINDKLFLSYFGEGISEKTDNIIIGLFTSETDDFQQFSLINGLTISDGGNHIDYIIDNIVNSIREKLIKKYKTIKPGDIRNRLKLVLVMKNFNRPEYNSQTKEKLTNDKKDIAEYFKEIDFTKLVAKILKTPEIIDPITEVYKIKEELKKRQELKNADKQINKKLTKI
jgi:DNA gyrase/topoisomerase IV subunit B